MSEPTHKTEHHTPEKTHEPLTVPAAAATPPPITAAPTASLLPQPSEKLTKLKTAFLYVLITGLAAAALTSVIALLIGQFNSAILKSLLTIFIFFTHGLFILAILWADRHNQIGKLLLPSTITALAFANLVTTTLGTWEIISTDLAWRTFGLYMLALGAVFVITGLLRLRIAQQATQIALLSTIGLIAVAVVGLAPWVLQIFTHFDPLYYRIIAALSILATAAFLIGLILRGIALGHSSTLKTTAPAKQPASGGMLAIYITVGTLTAFVWFAGFIGFIVSGVDSSTYHSDYTQNRYY
jgi:hypothetical protein